ncbi:stonustoxin subunit beta-like protein, partial [Lates japonicus]
VGDMASDYKTIAALGRPFTLGMLYDSQRNKLIPGTTLWDDKTLREKTCESPQLGSEFQITSSDSAEDKSNSLGVEASLGVSFLFGLVDVSGSAKYLYDYKTFKNQSRVILQYKATTHYKQLSMTPDEIKNIQLPGVIETGLATHVVVGILYGANAFFVFDSERLDSDSVHDYHGKMGAVIRKIPICSVYGEVDINLTPEEKSLTEKFSCKFYGDILLQHNPTTFQEALSAYAKLPQLLHSNGDNAVPLRVWLMPLTNLDSKAPKLNREITVGVVRKAQEAVEDLRQMEMRCNDSLEDRVVGNCPPIQKELKCFQKTCNYYQSKLQKMLEDNLLGHTGEGKEAEEQLFENREKSPFSHEKLSKWLNNKEREINVIKSCVEMMEGKKMEIETKIKMVPNQSALDREVLAPGVDHVLCYVFTSLENNDRYLKELAEYTDAFKLCELKSINAFPLAENTCAILYTPEWYFTDNVITKMREKARAFHGLAKALKNNSRFSFCVAAIANEDHEGATIYHYKNGILVTDNFSVPEISDPESIKDRNALIWYTCELTLDPSTVNGYLTLSDDNKEPSLSDKDMKKKLGRFYARGRYQSLLLACNRTAGATLELDTLRVMSEFSHSVLGDHSAARVLGSLLSVRRTSSQPLQAASRGYR